MAGATGGGKLARFEGARSQEGVARYLVPRGGGTRINDKDGHRCSSIFFPFSTDSRPKARRIPGNEEINSRSHCNLDLVSIENFSRHVSRWSVLAVLAINVLPLDSTDNDPLLPS